MRREWRAVTAAFLLLLLPLLAMLAAIHVWPDAAYLLLAPETVSEIEDMYSPSAPHLGRPRAASSEWAMWGLSLIHI